LSERCERRRLVSHALVFSMFVILASALVVTDRSRASRRANPVCTVAVAHRTVAAFLFALRAGRLGVLDDLFAPPRGFLWYSTTAPGARLNDSARDRSSLLVYFHTRIRRHEHLQLSRTYTGYDSRRNESYLNGFLVRRADDLPATRYGFKTAVSCSLGRPMIIVWSMAARASH
jgi:hypothetical protein